MAETSDDSNNKKAWSFLKTLRDDDQSMINLVAIDPHSLHVTGITRPVGDEAVFNFIEMNNGKRNLYFMVNTPFKDAPDNKLKKENVEFINAVWIDADPAKDKDFAEERERLLAFAKSLRKDENPPTFVIDSGGGIQAFWVLKQPIKVTDDSRTLYEAYSRALAEKYNTDKVQNIDRIMRVPYTWNIPTQKKKAAGRTKALSRLAKTGGRYE